MLFRMMFRKGNIFSIVIYRSELWRIWITKKQMVNVFEMNCLPNMTGVSRRDRIRNDVIRQRTGVRTEMAGRVEKSILRWFGHVERMNENCLTKRVSNASVDGRAPRGRPRFGWMDGVKIALNKRGMRVEEARVRAGNRDAWRAIVKSQP